MPETIRFTIPAPLSNETTPTKVNWYQSPNGLAWDAEPVDVLDISEDALPKTYTWTSQEADPNKYHQVKTEDSGGLLSSFGAIIVPRLNDPVYQQLYGTVKKLGVAWAEGDVLRITPVITQTISGMILSDNPVQYVIRANGSFGPDGQGVLVDKGANVCIELYRVEDEIENIYYKKRVTFSNAETQDISAL